MSIYCRVIHLTLPLVHLLSNKALNEMSCCMIDTEQSIDKLSVCLNGARMFILPPGYPRNAAESTGGTCKNTQELHDHTHTVLYTWSALQYESHAFWVEIESNKY